jgi:hypothetical protein|nr:MAG TPA: hypothetical protein [Herelleviridae sp.]
MITEKFELLGKLVKEIRDLKNKITKLVKFIESEDFNDLDEENKKLLLEQKESMSKYLNTLEKRFEINK